MTKMEDSRFLEAISDRASACIDVCSRYANSSCKPASMRVLVVSPSGQCEVKELSDSFHELQQLVGGGIEIVSPMELRDHPRIRMIVNEIFLYLDLPFNFFASFLYGYGKHRDPILGTAVFAYEGLVGGEPDLVGLPDEELHYLQSLHLRFNR